MGHLAKVCKSAKAIQEISLEGEEDDSPVYNVNIFRIQRHGHGMVADVDGDFKVKSVINNNLDSVLADTGAKV